MLDIIRDKAQSFGVKLIFGIIIVVFVFWGVGNIGQAPKGSLAVVNGEGITVQDFNKLFKRAVEEQKKTSPDLLSDPAKFKIFKQQVLAQVIMSRLRLQEAARIGLTVTPHELKRVLASFSVFQDAAGKFDPEAYKRVVASQGLTQGEFEAEYRDSLLEEKLMRGVVMSVDVTEAEAKALHDFSLEKRKAEYVLFSAADYKKSATVSDEEIQQYYDNNKESFKKPAMANLEFLLLTPNTLAAGYPVSDQEAQEYYDKNKVRFFQPESFRSRHIFIACPPDDSKAPGAEQAIKKAGEAINSIEAQLKKGGDFAALAAKFSEDKDSSDKGGEIGWLVKGQTGSGTFEDAALALKPGEISKPVRTEFGFHIIKLEEKKAAVTPPLAEMKKDVVLLIGRDKADADFKNVEKAAEDGLNTNVSFADLAKKFHVTVQTTGLKAESEAEAQIAPTKDSRQFLADSVAGLAAAPAGADGKAPEPVTVPVPLNVDGGIALVRVLEAKAAHIPPLDEVRQTISDRLLLNKGMELARLAAQKALPEFTGKEVPAAYKDKVKESQPAIRLFPEVRPLGLMQEMVTDMFSSTGDWLPRVYDSPEGAVIARTKTVEPVTEESWNQVKELFISQLKQRRQKEVLDAFMQRLIESAKIEERPDALDGLTMR